MKQFYSLIILSLLAFSSLFAQTDTKAKEILDKVSAKNKAYKTMTADFVFNMDNAEEDIHETSEGKIILKDNKYKLSIMGVDKYFDGTTLYTHIIDAEEVSITEPDEEDEEGLNPAKIFTIYETGFKYKYQAEKTINGRINHIIDLFPIDREQSFSRLRLSIDKTKLQINELKSIGKDGNNITVTVKKLIPDLIIDDTKFSFDSKANPDVELNDMR